MFSPNDKYIITGTSTRSDTDSGKLVILDRDSLEKVHELAIGDSVRRIVIYFFFAETFILKYLIQIKQSAVRTLWHPKLNQIFVTTGSGEIKVFYDPEKSQRGITQCALKAVKRKTGGAYFASNQIMNPHALPIFKKVILFN